MNKMEVSIGVITFIVIAVIILLFVFGNTTARVVAGVATLVVGAVGVIAMQRRPMYGGVEAPRGKKVVAAKSASKSASKPASKPTADTKGDTIYKKINLDKFDDNAVITLDADDEDYETIRNWFPDDIKDKKKLQIVKESIYSLSRKDASEKTSQSIKSILKDKDISQLTITDACANVGGNTLNFAKHFKAVNAMEIDENAFKALNNNINVAGLKNVNAYHGDYTIKMNELKQDVVFMDPPWGGVGYWREKSLMLKLGDKPIYDVINDMKNKPDLIVIKAPKNFAFSEFKQKVDSDHVWMKNYFNHRMVYVRFGTGPRPAPDAVDASANAE